MTAVRALVGDVLARDACAGCGLCTLLDRGLAMELDAEGYARPVATSAPQEIDSGERIMRSACPGIRVDDHTAPDATRDRLLGDYVDAWEAWATDPELRHAGSSGGALTAVHAWLLESGRAARITGAAASAENPRRTVPVTITTRAEALAAAGSRYAPVATLSNPRVLEPGSAVVAKPCEISALRAASPQLTPEDAPLLLSFFCAGTPSQHATDTLLAGLGVPAEAPVSSLWYRGRGWPGRFTARSGERTVDADYEESWGSVLGPTTQWRCKVCPDGVGGSADIVSADSWATDERGYPVFAEGDGVSAFIARTARGRDVVLAAAEAGVIGLRPLDMARLATAQPLQTNRRRHLLARMLGSRLAGRRPPTYRGFPLLRLAASDPRTFVRVLRGTYRRVKAARRGGAR